jgi:hypothetical protein
VDVPFALQYFIDRGRREPMLFRTPVFVVVGVALAVFFGPGAGWSQGLQNRIEGAFPRQLARGQTTLMNIAVSSRDNIQAAEISPSAGVRVLSIKRGENFQGALTWSELTVEVAENAMPGDRRLEIVLPAGRTPPVTITIPGHVPSISDLRVVPAQSSPPALELQFTATDTSADLGDSPYVWFMTACGSEIVPGIVYGKVTARDKTTGVVRAAIPNGKGKCDLQVRVTDSGGIESNTLKTAVDFKN